MKRFVIIIFGFSVWVLFIGDSLASDARYLPSYHERFKLIDSVSLSSRSKERTITAKNLEKIAPEIEKEEFGEAVEPNEEIADPLDPFNRFNYAFNDKLYFHVLKPVAKPYGAVMPERARISIQNFYLNLYTPVRMVSCAMQGDTRGACSEFSRFTVNTTLGVAGLFDPAASCCNLQMRNEDFGQYLGCFTGPGFYFNLPFLGPSSFRDSIGSLVDLFIVPSIYVLSNYPYVYMGMKTLELINRTSLTLGDYEELKSAAVDPYVSMRDAYHQHRENLVKE